MIVSARLGEETIGELLALLAHDLRNPLSALHSNLGFLRSLQEERDPDFDEAVDDGLVSCDGLNHIIDNLDLLGRVLRDAFDGAPVGVDALDLARDVVARSERAAASHGVRLDLSPDSVEVGVVVRRELSARALANLVRNSIQHAGSPRRVEVTVRREGPEAIITVLDGGAPLDVSSDLDPFSAAGQVASKGVQRGRYGRGLGLYCASVAASADGWRLGLESSDGHNAFVLRRPVSSSGE